MINHDQLPSIANAKLPAAYTVAKRALAECERIDECKDWADKAAALGSYAKQSKDESLFKMATRIQARAIRRCGELLKEIETMQVKRTDLEPGDGDGPKSMTRKSAAEKAGLSERQQKTAVRVANVPKEEFEAQIESDSPPTVTALAERGTQKKVFDPFDLMDSGISFEDHKLATHALGVGQELNKFISTARPENVWRGLMDYERSGFLADLRIIREWIDSIINLGGDI
jgi:hypothetical protein